MIAHGSVLTLVGLFAVSAPPTAPSFTEAWYREAFEGNVALAAKEYESIYLGQPTGKLTPLLQQRAAFRAGLCFERLGLPQSSVPAFMAAARAVGTPAPESMLATESILRLRSMQADMISGTGPDLSGGDARLDFAVQGATELLKASERSRFQCIATLEGQMLARQRLLEARAELIARLGAQGVDLAFATPVPQSVGDALLATLREAGGSEIDLARWIGALKARALTLALTALRSESSESALRPLQRLGWLSSGPGAAGDSPSKPFLEILRQVQSLQASPGGVPPGAVQLAERLLGDLAMERKASLCREIRARLDDAALAEGRGRSDLALPTLERARGLLDWSPSSSREDAETRSLIASAWLREQYLIRSSGSLEAIQHLSTLLRSQAERILQISESLMDQLGEELKLRGPAFVEGRSDARDFLRSEVEDRKSVV